MMKITSKNDLDYVSPVLYDGVIRLEDMIFEKEKKIFRLSLWIPSYDKSTYTPLWLFLYRKITPYKKVNLCFFNVDNCEIIRTENINHTELGRIRYEKNLGKLEIIGHYAVSITLFLSKLEGNLEDTEEIRDDWNFSRLTVKFKKDICKGKL